MQTNKDQSNKQSKKLVRVVLSLAIHIDCAGYNVLVHHHIRDTLGHHIYIWYLSR